MDRATRPKHHIAIGLQAVAATTAMGGHDAQLHENRYPWMLRISLPFLLLSYLAVLARLFARRYMKNSLAADDFVILIASVSSGAPGLPLASSVEMRADTVAFQHLRFREYSSS